MVYLASYNRNFSHINHTTLTIRDRQARLFCCTFFSNPGKNGPRTSKNSIFSGTVENSSSLFVASSTTKADLSSAFVDMVAERSSSPEAPPPKTPKLASVPHEIDVESVLSTITSSVLPLPRNANAIISSVSLLYVSDTSVISVPCELQGSAAL